VRERRGPKVVERSLFDQTAKEQANHPIGGGKGKKPCRTGGSFTSRKNRATGKEEGACYSAGKSTEQVTRNRQFTRTVPGKLKKGHAHGEGAAGHQERAGETSTLGRISQLSVKISADDFQKKRKGKKK